MHLLKQKACSLTNTLWLALVIEQISILWKSSNYR